MKLDGLMAMTSDDGLVRKLVRTDPDHGFVIRRNGAWAPLTDMAELEDLAFVGATDRAIDVYDSCDAAGLHIPIKHYPPSINGPYWPDPVIIDDDEFIYDEETGEYHRPEGVVEEDLYLHEFLGPDKQSGRLAYEPTFCADFTWGKRSPDAEARCVKTIAGFLNSTGGGTLLIGVTDDGSVHGIEGDYASRPDPKENPRDWFQEHLRITVSHALGEAAAEKAQSQLHHLRGHDICRVQVGPSDTPVHAVVSGRRPEDLIRSEFFVRIGKKSRAMDPTAKEQYIAQRWPG